MMSRENVELVKALLPDPDTDLARLFRDESAFAAAAEGMGHLFHPDLESVPAYRGAESTYTGIEGFREMWLDWLEPWASYHVQVRDIVDLGDRVLVLIRDRGLRHDTAAEVELISGSIWTVRDGRIARVEFYGSREDALEAAGLG